MTRATRRLLQHGANHAVVTSCRWASHCHPGRNARTGVARTDLPSSANIGKRHRQTHKTVDRLAGIAGCLLLGWLLYDAGFDVVERCLGRMGYGAALAAVPYTIASLCDALGWRAVLGGISAARPPFRRLWLTRLAGEAVNSVAPTGVGGEPLKALLLRNDGFSAPDAAAAVVVSRTAVTVTRSPLVVAGLTALLGRFHTGWATVSLVLLLAVAAAFFLLLVRLQRSGPMQLGTRVLGGVFPQSRLVAKFEDRAVAGDARLTTFYRSERATFVGAGCWHMLSWLACAAEVWLLLRLMGVAISCGDALIIEGLAQPIRAAAIIVPGALGVQESGGVAVCSWLGIGLDVSVAVWLVRRAREIVFDAVGLLYLAITGARAGRQHGVPLPEECAPGSPGRV